MYFPKPSVNENDLAIIERGDTASHSIEAGQYVSWKGKLGKAVSAILQGATLDDSLFSYEEDGVINSLSNKILWVKDHQTTTNSESSATPVDLSQYANEYRYITLFAGWSENYNNSKMFPLSANMLSVKLPTNNENTATQYETFSYTNYI